MAAQSKRFLLNVVLAVTLTMVACCAAIVYRNYKAAMFDFVPQPAADISLHPERTGIEQLREISFQSVQGVHLAGWYAPSKNRAAIVLTHGTNADRSSMLSETRILVQQGFGVLAFDWPGDGGSAGEIHWSMGERQALIAAIDWLAAQPDVNPEKIGGLGFSMGGFVMAQVAATDLRLHAVVLEAAPPDFAEYVRWEHRHWGVLTEIGATWAVHQAAMPVMEQRPVDVVKDIAPRPLLIIGGSQDSVVPEFMLRKLYQAAASPKSLWIVPGAQHGGYAQQAPTEYARRLTEFYSEHLLGARS